MISAENARFDADSSMTFAYGWHSAHGFFPAWIASSLVA